MAQRIRRSSALAWALTPLFLAGIGMGVTRSPLLWGHTSFENAALGPRGTLAQVYRAMRALYGPGSREGLQVVVLGNSRLIGLTDLERALARRKEPLEIRVRLLPIFAGGPVAFEALGRHVARRQPALVVVAVTGSDLEIPVDTGAQQLVRKMLRVGWRDLSGPPPGLLARLDRWLRTLWPFYRFREIARAALLDRIHPIGSGRQLPSHYRTTEELFETMRPGQGHAIEVAHRRFLADPSLKRFLDYLAVGQSFHVDEVRHRTAHPPPPGVETANEDALRSLLADLGAAGVRTRILLTPQNPILAQDRADVFHDPARLRRGREALLRLAAAQGTPVIDATRWLPAEAFLDFDHVLPDLGGFGERLAPEVWRALQP